MAYIKMKKQTQPKKTLHLALDNDFHHLVKLFSANQGKSISATVIEALTKFMDDKESVR
jgi:hypothetical protein